MADRWAAGYRRLAGRLTHEIRNLLNGVVVNLEVLKGRSAREEVSASALRPFVEAASGEGARAVALVESFLALARSAPAPVDLGGALRPLVAVLHAIAARSGGSVSLEESAVPVEAAADADSVRCATLAVTESSLDAGRDIRLQLDALADHVELRFSGVDAPSPSNIVIDSNVFLRPVASGGVLIRFPRPTRQAETP